MMKLSDELTLARKEIRTGRFQRTMAFLTGFSAIISGFESYVQHQRGAFSHWLMWTPVWLAPIATIAAIGGVLNRTAARWLLPIVSVASIVDGLVGGWYHLRGIAKRPGGFRLGQYNIVMGPPIFAPLLTCTVGVLGLLAGFSRRESRSITNAIPRRRRRTQKSDTVIVGAVEGLAGEIAHGQFQRGLAITSAIFGVLAGGEAYFEHMRGSYNSRVMWTPVWLTPPMVLSGIGAAISGRIARTVLPFVSIVTFLDGVLGFLLHLRGIWRMPGSFNNMRFNLTLGPPIFAPLLFSSVGLLGMLASLMRRKDR